MVSNGRRRRLAVGTALALIAALGVVSTTMATFPGRNGRITFMRDDPNGFAQVWVADSDLSHAKQLTDYQATSGWSAWSPDGSRILFDSDVTDPDHNNDPFIDDIFTMKPDGTDVVKLTDSIGYAGGSAAYSPDGRLIVFEADRGDYPAKAGIYVMNSKDGSHVRRITSLPEHVSWDGSPRFSPDGRRLVFTRFRDGYTKPSGQVVEPGAAVFTVKLDGSDLDRLTPWELNAGDADWSPDGSRLVFEAYPPEFPRGSAWVVSANGHGLKNLTPQPTITGVLDGYSDPVYSPDGTKILLVHGLYFDDGAFNFGLATMRPDGTHLKYVTDGQGFEHQPDWGRTPRH